MIFLGQARNAGAARSYWVFARHLIGAKYEMGREGTSLWERRIDGGIERELVRDNG
jgi:hypothetical protein